MDADGLNLRRLTFNESLGRPRDLVAGAVQRDRVFGADGTGLRHQDLRRRHRTDPELTDGAGRTRARHSRRTAAIIAFTSTRLGKVQIFTIARDGKDLRQITRAGNNTFPTGRDDRRALTSNRMTL